MVHGWHYSLDSPIRSNNSHVYFRYSMCALRLGPEKCETSQVRRGLNSSITPFVASTLRLLSSRMAYGIGFNSTTYKSLLTMLGLARVPVWERTF